MPKPFSEYSKKEWEDESTDAMMIWDGIPDTRKDPEFDLELPTCPMHPARFYELSSVQGFNKLNGWTYREYVEDWKGRRGQHLELQAKCG